MVKLCIKGMILLACLVVAAINPRFLNAFFAYRIAFFNVYHLFWLAIVLILVKRMTPSLNKDISSGKIFRRHYGAGRERTPAAEKKLASYVGKINRGALRVAFSWALVIAATGLLYYFRVFGPLGIFMVVLFFIFMDQFCVTLWCPFEWIIGNKCCSACRINNWGYLMAFAPLLFIPSFWTLSVAALSVAVVVQWEYQYHAHPERFFEFYNEKLLCRNCSRRCPKKESRFSH
ncbi:MAG TPA: hypothetical protein VGJ94_07330 [Syntrophorhabdaceae bacterium]|jgi:hypothetical protein